MSDTMTYLTDATMITAVVPAGRADDLLKVARDVGASGGIVHQARGTGARELLGLPWSVAPRARRLIASFCWAGVRGRGPPHGLSLSLGAASAFGCPGADKIALHVRQAAEP
jgi:hypothetical protein